MCTAVSQTTSFSYTQPGSQAENTGGVRLWRSLIDRISLVSLSTAHFTKNVATDAWTRTEKSIMNRTQPKHMTWHGRELTGDREIDHSNHLAGAGDKTPNYA
jgi:hypothetical protein